MPTRRHRPKRRPGAARSQSTEVVRRYVARRRAQADALFEKDASDLAMLGYRPVDVAWTEPSEAFGCLAAIVGVVLFSYPGRPQAYLDVTYEGPAFGPELPREPRLPTDWSSLVVALTIGLSGVLGWLDTNGCQGGGGVAPAAIPGVLLAGLAATLWLSRRSPNWLGVVGLVIVGPVVFGLLHLVCIG